MPGRKPAGGCHGPSRALGRTHAEVTRFFDGLELLPPPVVQLHHWHPEAAPEEGKRVPAYCGHARKF